MKQIRKLLALVLACMTLVLALPSTALAANRGEPAGYVSQVNSAFTMPKPGQALPTAATNQVADTIVTATWEPSGSVAVDQTYTCKVRLVLGDGDGYPLSRKRSRRSFLPRWKTTVSTTGAKVWRKFEASIYLNNSPPRKCSCNSGKAVNRMFVLKLMRP